MNPFICDQLEFVGAATPFIYNKVATFWYAVTVHFINHLFLIKFDNSFISAQYILRDWWGCNYVAVDLKLGFIEMTLKS